MEERPGKPIPPNDKARPSAPTNPEQQRTRLHTELEGDISTLPIFGSAEVDFVASARRLTRLQEQLVSKKYPPRYIQEVRDIFDAAETIFGITTSSFGKSERGIAFGEGYVFAEEKLAKSRPHLSLLEELAAITLHIKEACDVSRIADEMKENLLLPRQNSEIEVKTLKRISSTLEEGEKKAKTSQKGNRDYELRLKKSLGKAAKIIVEILTTPKQ